MKGGLSGLKNYSTALQYYGGGMGVIGIGRGSATKSLNFVAEPGKTYEIGATRVKDSVFFTLTDTATQKLVPAIHS